MQKKILIVDDYELNRKSLAKMLENEYEILEAEDGEKALKVLNRSSREISAVLLDLIMPNLDGYEVLTHMKSEEKLSVIPVIVITGSKDEDAELRALTLGATDFAFKPFCPEIIRQRLKNAIRMSENAFYVNELQKDKLTGIYNREGFLKRAEEMIGEKEPGYYVMVCFDINKFKLINDQYGTKQGDVVLRFVAGTLQEQITSINGICARFNADDFAMLYPKNHMDSAEVAKIHRRVREYGKLYSSLTVSIGRYIIDDLTLSVSAMYDRALMALTSIKGDFERKTALYDESMRTKLLEEQEIISEMQDALDAGQFEPWLQPQYNHATGAMIGVEALIRWRHPEKGLIPPYVFIPLFERNGFIYEADKYMWEQACILLRGWLDAGKNPLPVSVNVSRYDALRPDFFETITEIAAKYSIPSELFRLEITESAFSEAGTQLVNVIKELIHYGFIVEIDDFGSGFSSLNTLKDVPAQVLKLDMRFFAKTDNADRSGNIVQSIVRMAKWLGMAIIAEGVEDKQQADYLKSIGCYYIQGYYYAKPMPAAEYEKLLTESHKEPQMSRLQTIETFDSNEFWNPKSMETLIFNSYVGGACIFEYYEGTMELLRVNDRYVQELGALVPNEDVLTHPLEIAYLGEENRKKLIRNIETAISTHKESFCELMLSGVVDHKTHVEYLNTTVRVIARTGEHYLLYCVIVNTTERHRAEQERMRAEKKQLESASQLEVIMKNINGGVSAIQISDDGTSKMIFNNDKYYELYGYTKEQAAAEQLDVMILILPEDFPSVLEKINRLKEDRVPAIIDYRITKRNGKLANLRANASLMHMEGYGEVITSVISDVTEIISLQDQLRVIVDNINGGVTATVIRDGNPQFIVVNDQFFRMLGYMSREDYEAEHADKYTGVHPEDRERIIHQFETSDGGKKKFTMEYRVLRKDGEVRYIRNHVSVVHLFGVEEPVHLSVANDITDIHNVQLKEKEALAQLTFLNRSAHHILAQPDSEDAIYEILKDVRDYFDSGRSYVVELDYVNSQTSNTYEICADGVASEREHLQKLPFTHTDFWYEALSKNQCVIIEDVENLGENEVQLYDLLKSQNIQSMTLVPLTRDGKMIGFMGADNPKREIGQTGQMTALADYMAILLTRRDLNRRIERDYQIMQQLINDTPGGFMRMEICSDASPVIIGINDGFCRMLDMTQEEIMDAYGQNALLCLSEEDIATVTAVSAEAAPECGKFSIKCRLRRKNGGFIWSLVFGRFIRNVEGRLFLNTYFTEPEEQKMSMEQMMPYIFPEIMKSSTDITFVKDKEFRYLCCSNAYAKMLGLKDGTEVVGRTDLELFGLEIADRYHIDDRKLMEDGEPIIDKTEILPSKNGMPCYSRISKYLLRDATGNAVAIYGIGRDITEHQTTDNQLKLLQNSVPGGLATFIYQEGTTTLEYCNDRFYELLGCEKGQMNLTFNDMMNMVFEEDAEIVNQSREALVKDGTPINCVFRSHIKDDKYIWVNLKALIADRLKNMLIINAVFLDVTELQQEKEKIRRDAETSRQNYEREMQLRSEVMKDSISYYQLNITKKVIEDYHSIYPNWQEIRSGERADEVVRDKVLRGIVEEDHELVRSTMFSAGLGEAYRKGKTSVSIEFRSIIPNVGIRWTRGTATIMERYQSGDLVALINNQDIDVIKKDQIAIHTIMDEEIESVAVIDVASGLAHFAQLNINYTGLQVDESFEYKEKFDAMIHHVIIEQDRKGAEEFFDLPTIIQALEKKTIIKHLFRVKTSKGVIRHKKARAFYIDETHKEIALIGRDITDLYEEEQRRSRALQNAVDEANQANQAKSEFLSRMSHDMRTPLNAILSFSNDDIMRNATEEQHTQYLKKIHYSGEYLLGIISDVLDMSKIEQNKMTLKEAPYSFDEFKKIIDDVISESCRKKQIQFEMNFDHATQWILTDPVRLNQIFINLLSNAVKFTNPGGHIEFLSKSLSISDDHIDHRQFIIRDNGIGMGKDFIPKAFDSFEQENREQVSENNQGTGLGLPIVKRIVELMNGTIMLSSEEGKGTTFTIELPLQGIEEPKKEDTEEDNQGRSLQGVRVLLCEDNELNVEIAKMLLEGQGCIIDCAENGQEGVEMFANSEPGFYKIILMDIRMPVMNGYTATEKIRRMEREDAAAIPIIALSADVFTDDVKESADVGMNAYLSKPIDEKLLFETLRKWVS